MDDQQEQEQIARATAVLDADIDDEGTVDLGERDDEQELIAPEFKFVTPKRKPQTEEQAAEQNKPQPFDLDGQTLYAYRPKAGAWTLILAALSNSATQADRTQAIMQFVYASLDEPSQMWVQHRLMDPGDEFDVDMLSKIVGSLIRKWAPAPNRKQRREANRNRGRS